jgi:hypothetical protein
VVPTVDPIEDLQAFLRMKTALARDLGALPVLTFYCLLQMGRDAGHSGSEPDVVRLALQDAAVMRRYFDYAVSVLQAVRDEGAVILHAEPDSWGFMIWAFGIEGNADATSVPVRVASSGHPDLAGLPDHAGGLGRALLALRDRYAPDVRMAWHASNFRAGTRPEVVAGFYSSMGEWDAVVSESPHNEADEAQWWLPWDEARVETNLAWFAGVSGAAGVPLLLWQLPIGTTDFHLLGRDGTERAMLERFARTGIAGLMMDMRGTGDPDEWRASESADLAAVPPPESGAGGTAADMRARLAAYAGSPLDWPSGSPCAAAADADADLDAGAEAEAAADAGAGPDGESGGEDAEAAGEEGGEGGDRDAPGAEAGGGETSGGCGCRAGSRRAGGIWAVLAGLLWAAGRRRG